MPSFSDSIFIFILALMLFGPKKLPQLARQLGKLMAEFRRASNEFRMQMEDELRIEEQKEHQGKLAAPAVAAAGEVASGEPPHPHMPTPATLSDEAALLEKPERTTIAESGALKMMAPATGLPVSRREGSAAEAEQMAAKEAEASPKVVVFSTDGAALTADAAELPEVPEHSILDTQARESSAGMSSEEPAAADALTEEPVHHV